MNICATIIIKDYRRIDKDYFTGLNSDGYIVFGKYIYDGVNVKIKKTTIADTSIGISEIDGPLIESKLANEPEVVITEKAVDKSWLYHRKEIKSEGQI